MLQFRAVCEQAAELAGESGRIAYVVRTADGGMVVTLDLKLRGECLIMVGRYDGSVHIEGWSVK